jgi:hypothetical protein
LVVCEELVTRPKPSKLRFCLAVAGIAGDETAAVETEVGQPALYWYVTEGVVTPV